MALPLQERILSDYRKCYPKHTLRKIAEHTGIQLTRVFRLMNGAPMKLDEYERFHQIIQSTDCAQSEIHFKRTMDKVLQALPRTELRLICETMERRLQWHDLTHDGVSQEDDESNIA